MSNVVSDHAGALLGLLRANPLLANVVYDGRPPRVPDLPYVVAYIHVEFPKIADGNTLAGDSRTALTRAICHCVGADTPAARAMGYQVRAALLDVTPTVAGRDCDQIGQESSQVPTKDESTGTPVMDQVDTYHFYSYPA